MEGFTNKEINFDLLKKRAFNMRWAMVDDGVIPLTAADHDFPVAPEIVKSLIDYISDGYFPYIPNRGTEEFKHAIADFTKRRKNEDLNPDWILPIDSAASGMMTIARAFVKPGDECIVFDPVDFLFRTSMGNAGGEIKLFPTQMTEDGISLKGLEDYITPKTKMIGFCNPHNPMGMLYKKEELEYLLDLSEKYGFYIMNDEIWSDMIYPGNEFLSLNSFGPERNKRTLTVYGLSKSFGLAGLRIGAVWAMNQENYDKLVDASYVDSTIGGINLLSQVAGTVALNQCEYRLDQFIENVTENRNYVLSRIEKMPGIKCHTPQATFVLFPDITETGMDPVDFVDLLRDKYKLYIVPGGARFFGPGSEGHVRICLATSIEIIEEAMNRLEQCMNDIMSAKQ